MDRRCAKYISAICLILLLVVPSYASTSNIKAPVAKKNVVGPNAVTGPNAVNQGSVNEVVAVSYGPISVAPHDIWDWNVPYGINLPGATAKAITATLSIPWFDYTPHDYSINTENNYVGSDHIWVEVHSLDNNGIPGGTWLNVIAVYGWQNY